MGVAAMSKGRPFESLTGASWDRNGGSLAIRTTCRVSRVHLSGVRPHRRGQLVALLRSTGNEHERAWCCEAPRSYRLCTTDAFCASESPSKAGSVSGADGRV